MKKGNVVRLVQYLEVTEVGGVSVVVNDLNRNIDGIKIFGQNLVDSLDSADEFNDVQKVTKTELAAKFVDVKDNVFTVVFEKQDGTERTLRGYMINEETGMGRSQVIDLE